MTFLELPQCVLIFSNPPTGSFAFSALMDKNAIRSAELAELNSDHQAVWDHVIGAPPYGRSEQNGNGTTSSGYKLGRRNKIDS